MTHTRARTRTRTDDRDALALFDVELGVVKERATVVPVAQALDLQDLEPSVIAVVHLSCVCA